MSETRQNLSAASDTMGDVTISDLLADGERCYRAAASRDARFDGVFYVGVSTTGIYCRPSCPAVTPKRRNVSFFPSAAAAQGAGFRACRRCRPDASPGSPLWDVKADVTGRAMRLIADGVVDRDGVAGLAARTGYTSRHLGRLLTEQLGAGPLTLARVQRAHTARILIETTSLHFADVAFAAGFTSIRQFNDTMRETYDTTPTQLRATSRARRHSAGSGSAGSGSAGSGEDRDLGVPRGAPAVRWRPGAPLLAAPGRAGHRGGRRSKLPALPAAATWVRIRHTRAATGRGRRYVRARRSA